MHSIKKPANSSLQYNFPQKLKSKRKTKLSFAFIVFLILLFIIYSLYFAKIVINQTNEKKTHPEIILNVNDKLQNINNINSNTKSNIPN